MGVWYQSLTLSQSQLRHPVSVCHPGLLVCAYTYIHTVFNDMLFVKYTTCVDMIRDSMLYINSVVQFEVIYEIEIQSYWQKGKRKRETYNTWVNLEGMSVQLEQNAQKASCSQLLRRRCERKGDVAKVPKQRNWENRKRRMWSPMHKFAQLERRKFVPDIGQPLFLAWSHILIPTGPSSMKMEL